MLYFFKAFETIYKKNKALITITFYLAITALGSLAFNYFYTYTAALGETKKYLVDHESRIENIEKVSDHHADMLKNMVTRPSFNAYIKRKDTEMLEQNTLNRHISEKLGFVSGQLSAIDQKFEILYKNFLINKVD